MHDYLRGYPGLFDKLSNGIRFLVAEREKQGKKFPITVKPTVNSKNFRLMPELVEWAIGMGVSCISFQPMDRWTPETYDELKWIEAPELPRVRAGRGTIDRNAATGGAYPSPRLLYYGSFQITLVAKRPPKR